jgi:hypothetical protein
MNKKNSKFYIYNGFMLLIAFFFVRILTILPNWHAFFSLMHTHEFHSIETKYKIICVFSCVPLDGLNLFWFSKMFRMAKRSFKVLLANETSAAESNKQTPVHVSAVINTEAISNGISNASIEKKIA